MALAGSSPTRIVASPGGRPVRPVKASTSRARSARTRAAIALPSMIVAIALAGYVTGRVGRRSLSRAVRPPGTGGMPPGASTISALLGDRRVLGHELALAAVTGEPHDDHAARLRADHDALAERGVDDVVAQRPS